MEVAGGQDDAEHLVELQLLAACKQSGLLSLNCDVRNEAEIRFRPTM